ncbi:MAG: type I methionyl aminopeptidase [Candidatus Paceibacterota bacterium]|jgi:methionyl aminopeptidase|nr:type I methionyl aminopeptidase [Candidatus Paceibacterota bacterium]
MSIIIKSPKEIEILREGGKRLAHVLDVVEKAVRPGVSTKDLDKIAYDTVIEMGDTPAFLNYQPYGADFPYPGTICLSVNDEIVHGLPKHERILQEGDIIGLDMGIIHGGLITDSARTVAVGKISEKAQKLMDTTKKALEVGISAIKIGGHVGDVGYAIERFVKPYKYGIVRELGGHGVGRQVHEDPYIPNFGTKKGVGAKWKPGMVVAIEPMLNEGKRGIVLDRDGYTYRTADRSLSAHFEHTIAITKDGVEILTK